MSLPSFRLAAALAALGLAAAMPAAAATMYKWVDANGRVVYSDQPPPGNVKTEIVKPPPPPANPSAAQDLEEQQYADKQREKKKAEDAKAADKARLAADRRRENCQAARTQIRALQDAGVRLFRYNESGEKVYYNDDMRRAEIERQQQIARESCTD